MCSDTELTKVDIDIYDASFVMSLKNNKQIEELKRRGMRRVRVVYSVSGSLLSSQYLWVPVATNNKALERMFDLWNM